MIKIDVFPVERSPIISCLWPLPTGSIESTKEIPQMSESLTFQRRLDRVPFLNRE